MALLNLFHNQGRGSPIGGAVDTVYLPKNLLVNPGTLWEDFETAGDWSGSGVEAANTSEFKEGTQSMKSTIAAGSWNDIWKAGTWDLSYDWNQSRYWFYLHDADMSHYLSNFVFDFVSGADTYRARPPLNLTNFKAGWNSVTWPKNTFIADGTPDWAAIDKVYFAGNAYATGTVAMSYDSLYLEVESEPCVLYGFDDGDITQYTEAFDYMKIFGIRGTLFLLGSWLDDGTHITTAQCLEMQNAGWTIGNHTENHTDLTTLNVAEQETEIALGKATLDGAGLTGSYYVAYPDGKMNEDTRIAMTNLGYRWGISTQPTGLYLGKAYPSPTLPIGDQWNVPRTVISDSVSLATAKTMKDTVIENGTIWTPYFHSLGTGAPEWTVADFQALVDYRRSEITHITIDDLYNLTLGGIRVPRVR